MSTTASKSLSKLRPAPFLTSGQLSKETGLAQSRIQELVPEGLPAYQLDQRRYVYDRDEAIAWLTEHGHLVDPYRAAIKCLVDEAPPLTADQAARIRAVLTEAGDRHASLVAVAIRAVGISCLVALRGFPDRGRVGWALPASSRQNQCDGALTAMTRAVARLAGSVGWS